MTCREKLAIEHPDEITNDCLGGCRGCPEDYLYLGRPSFCGDANDERSIKSKCTACWDREIPGTEKKEEPADKIDIHKIIDDAMEKKDRTVSIYIGRSGTTINVQPYEVEQARWLYNEKRNNYTYDFECSACGGETDFPSTYCPRCGEQMKMPEEEYSPLAHPETYVSDAIAMINDMTDAQRAEVMNHLNSLGKEETDNGTC